MKYLKYFEIASIITPNFIKKQIHLNHSYFEFKVNDDVYYVSIFLFDIKKGSNPIQNPFESVDDLTTFRVDFDLKTEEQNKSKLTNKNIPLQILGNIMGVIKYWIEFAPCDMSMDGDQICLPDVNIQYICIDSKMENDEDLRRSNIYNYYFEKYINSKIKNKKTGKFDFGEEFKTFMTVYEIEPTKLSNILKI